MKQFVIVSLALVALTLVVFLPLANHEFITFDDKVYVTTNPHVLPGLTWEGFTWALTATYAVNWHPLTWLSHMLDVQLLGLWAGGHHLVSLLLHVGNVLLLFALLRGLTGEMSKSAVVAALFAIHPLHVESVAWLSERKDLLSTFLGLLAALQFLAFVRRRRTASYLLAVAFFGLALAAKPMIVTLPVILLLLDWWPLRRFAHGGAGGEARPSPVRLVESLLLEKAPLFLLALVAGFITLHAQGKGGAFVLQETLSGYERLGNALLSYAWYIGRALYPADLSFFYPLMRGSIPAAHVAGAFALLAASSAAVVLIGRRRPSLIAGWVWFLVILLPVIGLVQVGSQARADRYTYLSLVGLFLAAVWFIGDVARRYRPRWLVGAGFSVALVALSAAARCELGYWRTTETLTRRALEILPGNWVAHNILGGWLLEQGKPEEAVAAFRDALADNPSYLDARENLALALARGGRAEEALGHLAEILSTYPAVEDAASRLSRLQYQLGLLLAEQGKARQAIRLLEEAVRLQPNDAEMRYDLGKALDLAGEAARAIEQYREALRLRPAFPEAHNNLGADLAEAGERDAAVQHFREALRLDPGYQEASTNLRRAASH